MSINLKLKGMLLFTLFLLGLIGFVGYSNGKNGIQALDTIYYDTVIPQSNIQRAVDTFVFISKDASDYLTDTNFGESSKLNLELHMKNLEAFFEYGKGNTFFSKRRFAPLLKNRSNLTGSIKESSINSCKPTPKTTKKRRLRPLTTGLSETTTLGIVSNS